MKKTIVLITLLFVILCADNTDTLTDLSKSCLQSVKTKHDIQECLQKNQPKTKEEITIEKLKAKNETCQEIGVLDRVACMMIEHSVYDKMLNEEYKRAMKLIKVKSVKESLKDAQRKWLAYMDAKCKSIYRPDSGQSIGFIGHASCIISITKERATELRSIADNADDYYNSLTFLDDKKDN